MSDGIALQWMPMFINFCRINNLKMNEILALEANGCLINHGLLNNFNNGSSVECLLYDEDIPGIVDTPYAMDSSIYIVNSIGSTYNRFYTVELFLQNMESINSVLTMGRHASILSKKDRLIQMNPVSLYLMEPHVKFVYGYISDSEYTEIVSNFEIEKILFAE